MKQVTISASTFKAQCLGILDRVARTGRAVLITKRGKPIALVSPAELTKRSSLRGSVVKQGDLISPVGVDWKATK